MYSLNSIKNSSILNILLISILLFINTIDAAPSNSIDSVNKQQPQRQAFSQLLNIQKSKVKKHKGEELNNQLIDNSIDDMRISHVDRCLLGCDKCLGHQLNDENIYDEKQNTILECANYCLSIETPQVLDNNILFSQLIKDPDFETCMSIVLNEIYIEYLESLKAKKRLF